MRKRIVLSCCFSMILFLCMTSCVLATDLSALESQLKKEPGNVSLLKEIGVYYHTLGDQGDKDAVSKGIEYFEKAMKLAPEDQTLKAWYGSLLTMVARDSMNPLTKYFKVKEGLKYMDEAVEKYPDNYEIRMTRAMTTKSIPNDIFGRLRQSVDDFSYLINKEIENPGYLPQKEFRLAYLNIGIAMKEGGDLETATKCWQKVIELGSESEEAKKAQELLAKYAF